MKPIVTVLLCFASLRVFGGAPLPQEFVGEWRTRATQPYNAIYVRPNCTAGFIAAGHGQVSVGGDGFASFDTFRRELTLKIPDSPRKQVRFIYDPKQKMLAGEAGRYKCHSEKVPVLLVRPGQ